MSDQLHKVQISILKTLRRNTSVRFTDLMKQTELESDTFKFHLRSLVASGYAEKIITGKYQLTSAGKHFANTLDEKSQDKRKQPKLSVIIVVEKHENGKRQYLLQQRKRNPFYGFWGVISGPVRFGELPNITAYRELKKQTGLEINTFAVTSIRRTRTFINGNDTPIDDELFTVLHAIANDAHISQRWQGGELVWATLSDIKALSPQFKETLELLDPNQPFYSEHDTMYTKEDY